MYSNQRQALDASIRENFASGVHAHATGTGKSLIALELIGAFVDRSSHAVNILWICEQKSILQEQFATNTIRTKGHADTLKRFIVHDFSTAKPSTWPQTVSSAAIWRKPQLIIINRAFLTSQLRYQELRIPIHLIVHDECHSITNATTRAFYEYVAERWSCSCIGFSATPCLDYAPFNRIISQYSIYDGVADGVILPPHIVWIKSRHPYGEEHIQEVYRHLAADLPYKKVIIWCGMIEACRSAAATWAAAFPDYSVHIDTSQEGSVQPFVAATQKAFLFCAAKHREGSDIPNVDACIFLDRVANRNAKTFVQCVGRVLRRAPHKRYGLVIDCSAASSIRICDRMNEYLAANQSSFPFTYEQRPLTVHDQQVDVHWLRMTSEPSPVDRPISTDRVDLAAHFVRPVPPAYADRLHEELQMIYSKGLSHYLHLAVQILEITAGIPHVTRGSCGSSLVCYLLGISNVDPVKYNISFARFLNEFRHTLPDIDFDFPYNMRDDVFLQLELRWPGRIARISNHLHYHERSALRAAVKQHGIKANGNHFDILDRIKKVPLDMQKKIKVEAKSLENRFRGYSLHCGGIIFYPNGVPAADRLNTKRGSTIAQVRLDKRDVSEAGQFKIDILSSRALAILYECNNFQPIQMDQWTYDEAAADLFCNGDNIGIILGESPLIRKAFLHFQPRTIDDLAICLAIIRPAARDAKQAATTADLTAKRVYDDDAITLIARALNCSEGEADKWRRGLTKEDPSTMRDFAARIRSLAAVDRSTLVRQLEGLRAYSFCKAHAYSYAQLVWHLAVMKARRPRAFWAAVLKHADSYYRPWVHLFEARLAGIHATGKGHASIYAAARRRKAAQGSPWQLIRRRGVWDMSAGDFFPNCGATMIDKETIRFGGLVAATRIIGYGKTRTVAMTVGVGAGQYIDMLLRSPRLSITGKVYVCGTAKLIEPHSYLCTDAKLH
jgi:superfamily II DNA or RNA helicase